MADQLPHARAFDIPGWPCPPRVRDIPNQQESWGRIRVIAAGKLELAQDELGYLWVNGNAVPQFDPDGTGGAIVYWTEAGIGLWVPAVSAEYLASVSRLDMDPDEWLPVREVAAERPAFIKRHT